MKNELTMTETAEYAKLDGLEFHEFITSEEINRNRHVHAIALYRIHKRKLWTAKFKTFNEYIKNSGFSRSQIYKLITCGKIILQLQRKQ